VKVFMIGATVAVSFRMVSLLAFILLAGIPREVRSQSDERIEDAKKEGQLVFYSGMIVQDTQIVLTAFEKRYPFIKTTHYRARGSALVARIQSEARAGRQAWDVYNSTGFEGYVLLEQGYFGRFDSPERKHYPDGHRDREGYWTTMYTTPMLPSYNTRLVSARDLPIQYTDFLQPKWKGKLGLDPQDFEWYANLRKTWGAEKARSFVSGLVKQDVILRQGRALLTDLLGAGEFSILVNNYLPNVFRVRDKGSPTDFFPLDPVIAGAGPIGINRVAPHPNAARLFVDFCLSKEGQSVLIGIGKSSARSDVPGNPMNLLKGPRIVPSDLSLGKIYVETRKEYEELLRIRN
jgi:iron(III) transport system substrate-binding protein